MSSKHPGKFSLRLVPSMTPENVDGLVIKFVKEEFAKLKSKNKLSVENLHGGKPWVCVIFLTFSSTKV
jgi:Cys-Gly metallodipeptidase DUG1